jgi:hypothetical protein
LARNLLDTTMMMRRYVQLASGALLVLAACTSATPSGSSSATSSVLPGSGSPSASASASAAATPFPAAYQKGATYAPILDPAKFVATVDNPFFPLTPGTRWEMRANGDAAGEVTITQVTHHTKTIMGIKCVVVHDEVRTDGEVTESTQDWYAQDADGNVWYMGEQTAEYKNGQVTTRAGSWEAGVGGAVPGIIMAAQPVVNLTYRQEFLKGEAEDLAKVVDLSSTARTAFRTFSGTLVTQDWSPLEPKQIEDKFYASGVGLVMERLVKGGTSTNVLTDYRPGS